MCRRLSDHLLGTQSLKILSHDVSRFWNRIRDPVYNTRKHYILLHSRILSSSLGRAKNYRYSWVYDSSVFCSLWYKNTICRMYQVRMYHTPAILRYTTHTRVPWPKLADFDTTISHSFLGQISYMRHRNPLWVSAPATHQTCFALVAWGCSFLWGLF